MKKYKTNILSVTAIVLLVIILSACNGEKATDTSSTTTTDKTTTTTTIAEEKVTAECGGIEVDIPDGFQESNAEGTKEMVEGMGFKDFKSYATSEEEGIKTINLSYMPDTGESVRDELVDNMTGMGATDAGTEEESFGECRYYTTEGEAAAAFVIDNNLYWIYMTDYSSDTATKDELQKIIKTINVD